MHIYNVFLDLYLNTNRERAEGKFLCAFEGKDPTHKVWFQLASHKKYQKQVEQL